MPAASRSYLAVAAFGPAPPELLAAWQAEAEAALMKFTRPLGERRRRESVSFVRTVLGPYHLPG